MAIVNSSRVTPALHTACSKSLYTLEEHLLKQHHAVEEWFQHQWQLSMPPVYGSIDLRNAGFKLAPIDMNLFPAGFNNLNPEFLTLEISAAKKILQTLAPGANKILLIPESHTRNLRYWENVKTLEVILQRAGFDVRLGSFDQELKSTVAGAPLVLQVSADITLSIEAINRQDDLLTVANFTPDLILLNNDLSAGIPEILRNIKQPILPPVELGWSHRLKSKHFQDYADVTNAFAKQFDFDPWLITPLFRHCGQVDFLQQEGMACIIHNAELLFAQIQQKYQEYQISHQPFLIVKADSGTYGMAVMTVRHVDELKTMNRKQRTKMASTKGGQAVERVIIQEGVHTFETVQSGNEMAVAEPVIYLWGDQVIGGFYRVHKARGVDENLNAPGMQFEPLAFKQICHEPTDNTDPQIIQNQYYIYGLVAKLSMLAAAREIKEHQVRK